MPRNEFLCLQFLLVYNGKVANEYVFSLAAIFMKSKTVFRDQVFLSEIYEFLQVNIYSES